MALVFGAATSDRDEIASNAAFQNLTTLTAMGWFYPTTLTSGRCLYGMRREIFSLDGTGGNLKWQRIRATTATNYITNDTPMSLDQWCFSAITFDEAATPEVHIYVGNLSAIVVESAYGTSTDGSGALTSDVNKAFRIGNQNTQTAALQGRIGNFQYCSSALSLGDIRRQQFKLCSRSDTLFIHHLGFNGTGSQTDYSGNGYSGTVTGATVGDHVPLGMPFGFDDSSNVVAGGAAPVNAMPMAMDYYRRRRAG